MLGLVSSSESYEGGGSEGTGVGTTALLCARGGVVERFSGRSYLALNFFSHSSPQATNCATQPGNVTSLQGHGKGFFSLSPLGKVIS
jgi:hypothetical protein